MSASKSDVLLVDLLRTIATSQSFSSEAEKALFTAALDALAQELGVTTPPAPAPAPAPATPPAPSATNPAGAAIQG